jgi:hypothetical protein
MGNQEWIDRQAYKQFLQSSNLEPAVKQGNPDPSKSFVGVVKLGELAKQGDPKAREALLEFANKAPEGDNLVSYYAKWELSQLGGAQTSQPQPSLGQAGAP